MNQVFAVTASGPRESSWSVYCFEHEIIPCLGDEFSVTWIEDQSNVIFLIFTNAIFECVFFIPIYIYTYRIIFIRFATGE